MSDDNVIISTTPTTGSLPTVVNGVLSDDPYKDIPPEKLLSLMQLWRGKIEEEIAEHEGKKAKIYEIYKRQKAMYDKWLSGPIGKMKKFDKLISGRKKVLIDIDREIDKIKENQIPTTNAQ